MREPLKGTAFLLLATGALLLAAPARAQVYWRLDTGWSNANEADLKDPQVLAGEVDDVGDSYILGGGIGYRFTPSLRGDLTLGYRGDYNLSTDKNGQPFKGDVKSTVLMASAYYDFSASGIRPFVGAGVGVAQNTMEHVMRPGVITTTFPDGKKNNAAFALMAGVGFPVSGRWILEVGYRYIDLGKIQIGSGSATISGTIPPLPPVTSTIAFSGAEGRLTAHELTIGVRF